MYLWSRIYALLRRSCMYCLLNVVGNMVQPQEAMRAVKAGQQSRAELILFALCKRHGGLVASDNTRILVVSKYVLRWHQTV